MPYSLLVIIITSLQRFNYKDLQSNKNPKLSKYINLSCMQLETSSSRWYDRVANFFFLFLTPHLPSLNWPSEVPGGASERQRSRKHQEKPTLSDPMHLVMIFSMPGGWWKLTFLLKGTPHGLFGGFTRIICLVFL